MLKTELTDTSALERSPSAAGVMASRTGVLLLNFGGPWTLDDVKPFLFRLFSDPAILVGMPHPVRLLIAFLISRIKGPSSVENYRAIGGGSPQLRWTEAQASGLQTLLGEERHRVAIGMRASEPSIGRALAELREWGAEEVILLPLFPQFSTTTSGTCFGEVRRRLTEMGWSPALREVTRWPDHPGYLGLMRKKLGETLARAEAERGGSAEPIHVLFSAHSLPMSIVQRGDRYADDVLKTVQGVAEGLAHPWTLCYQSRNGKMKWLEPYFEDEIVRLGREGIRRVVVVPVSFVSDHIETLYELDQQYAEEAKVVGVTHYYRVPTFNGDPGFAEVLRDVLRLGARETR